MAAIMEKEGFKLLNIILSKEKPFSFDDLIAEVQHYGLNKSEKGLKKSLDNLKDNGFVTQCGSLYIIQR